MSPQRPRPITADGPVQVDSFLLKRHLGSGAMGDVYLAEEAITNRKVAVKFVQSRIQDDPAAMARFHKEIEAAATLVHPNIALFAGHGTWNGMTYMAMELVEGVELATFVQNGARLSEEIALFLIIQIAEALEYAHQRTGLVHRDIKPGNIILQLGGSTTIDSSTRAKIIDFGLASFRATLDQEFTGDAAKSIHKTQEDIGGQTVGTPAYMPPEQVRGDAQITFAADVYSLGATLYHLLTGRIPYEAKSPSLILVAHLQEPVPDPSKLVPELRASVRDLVMRAMAKDPGHRHKSWEQFIAAARAALKLVQQGTVRITARQLKDPSRQRHERVDESARFVRRALGDIKPGTISGADALGTLIARRSFEKSNPDQGTTPG